MRYNFNKSAESFATLMSGLKSLPMGSSPSVHYLPKNILYIKSKQSLIVLLSYDTSVSITDQPSEDHQDHSASLNST